MKNVIKIILLLVVVIVLAGYLFVLSMNEPKEIENSTFKSVTIEMGSSTSDIANKLASKGIIDNAKHFKILSKLNRFDGKFQAGTYSLSPSMTPTDIAKIIVNGHVETLNITIPEGYTIYQIADKLSEEGVVDYDTFVDLLENGDFKFDFLENAQDNENHLEGYLFPSTYQLATGASEEQIITTMLNQFDLVFTDEYLARTEELNLTVNDIVTIASIIERECKDSEDRAKVASVIYNRIDQGMPLQMCSTVQYALGEQTKRLSIADTKIDSPYNTYVHAGIPPGPIGAPGESSIIAALYPADTDYLFFVVSEKLDGTHNFSSDITQFEKDKAAYNLALEEYEAEQEKE
ncbi:MAG: endolytic transglycosylase MltG [Peptostreptococcaceae bacterium]|nr:endolytic transglycosylase MltG [Peptostreptococcaceae bacterium]